MTRTALAIALIAGLSFAAAGPARADDKKTTSAKPAAKAATLDQVKEGMSDTEVRELLGNPTEQGPEYPSPKHAIPFYYGNEGTRQNWSYAGKGTVIMMRNRYNGQLSVLEVHPDGAK